MTLYRILLFVHVVAAVMLLGPIFAHPLVRTFRGNPIIANVLKIEEALARIHVIGVIVMLVTGGWLITESPTTDGRFGDATWLHLSLVLYVAWAGVTTGGLVPALRKARSAHETGGDQQATPLLDLIDNRWIPITSALVAMITFLMTFKPFDSGLWG